MNTLSVEQTAEETFLQNINYLQASHANIYNKLTAFDSAVEQNFYICRYSLEYINDSFDAKDLSTNRYLYGGYGVSSDQYATMATKEIDFSRATNLFETFKRVTITDEQLSKYKQLSIFENNLSGHADILNYIQKTTQPTMNKIHKFIFFGVGLGTHITTIDEKINASSYLIIEDNLELFRLSLFIVPYFEIAKKSKLIFSIFDSKDEYIRQVTHFLNNKFFLNHYIKYLNMFHHQEDKFQEFHLQIASQSHHLFFYNSILEQYLRPLHYLNSDYNFVNILQKCKTLINKPVLLLAAGPSLQANIDWLTLNQDKFLIVAASAILNILEQKKIVPSIVINLDGFKESIVHFEDVCDLSFFDSTIFLLSSRTRPEIVNMLDKKNLFFFESSTNYKKESGNLTAFCVGSTAYLLLLALGVNQLYLLGLDLAINKSTGSTHSAEHPQARTIDLSTISQEKDTMVFNDNIVEVDGNFEEKVYTTSGFATSIASINATNYSFKKSNQLVYNLSNGAKFINTIPLKIANLNTSKLKSYDKNILHKQLIRQFNKHSSQTLSKQDIEAIKNMTINAKNIKAKIIIWQNNILTQSDEFLKSLEALITELYSIDAAGSYDLAFINQEYFRLIGQYIFDHFNNQSLSNTKSDIQNIQDMLSWHLLNIVDLYINATQASIKEC